MVNANRIPVIAAIGEYVDRPEALVTALEPVALMERALHACEADANASLTPEINLISSSASRLRIA